MSIMTMEMRGLGANTVSPEVQQAIARQYRATGSFLNVVGGPTSLPPIDTGVPSAGSLLAQYGPTVGAGLAGDHHHIGDSGRADRDRGVGDGEERERLAEKHYGVAA